MQFHNSESQAFELLFHQSAVFVTIDIMIASIVYAINAATGDPDFLMVVTVLFRWPLPLPHVMTLHGNHGHVNSLCIGS